MNNDCSNDRECEVAIQGGKALFYGNNQNYPCGVQLVGKNDLGNQVVVDFEIYSSDDLGIRRIGLDQYTTVANFNPDEVANFLIRGFRRCGCNIAIKE